MICKTAKLKSSPNFPTIQYTVGCEYGRNGDGEWGMGNGEWEYENVKNAGCWSPSILPTVLIACSKPTEVGLPKIILYTCRAIEACPSTITVAETGIYTVTIATGWVTLCCSGIYYFSEYFGCVTMKARILKVKQVQFKACL